ncbi:MAG: hypothetical protein NVS9B4_19890 [Candidatus Acidiferrum sp.]
MLQWFLPGLGKNNFSFSPATFDENARALLAARMVRAAMRHSLTHKTCLEESLTLWWLLASQGISSELRIGVRKEAGHKLEAHAWVEIDAVPLSDSKTMHHHYTAFDAEFSESPPVVP